MDEIELNEVLLNSILERETLLEKQSAKERYAEHKKWREKNPEKVRAQVKRHEKKTRSNPNNPQTGQAARRDEERNKKDQGKKSKNPACAVCGSRENVEYDHDRGYHKGAPTTPRCHKHHTARPQQNKPGEKSVKGGTIKVHKDGKNKNGKSKKKQLAASYNRIGQPLLEADPGFIEKVAKIKGGYGAQALGRRHRVGKIKPRKKISQQEGPVAPRLYPHLEDPRIKVHYTNEDILNDFEIANTENYSPKEVVTIQIVDSHDDWKDAHQDASNNLEREIRKLRKSKVLQWSDEDEMVYRQKHNPSYGPSYAGQELVGRVLGTSKTTTKPEGYLSGYRKQPGAHMQYGERLETEEDEEITSGGYIRFLVEGGANEANIGKELLIPKKYLQPYSMQPLQYTRLVPAGDEKYVDDDTYLNRVAQQLQRYGSGGPWTTMIMPHGEYDDEADSWGNWQETAEEYMRRIRPYSLQTTDLYNAKTETGLYLALERDGDKWRWLQNPRENFRRIGMIIPTSMRQPFDILDYNQEHEKPGLEVPESDIEEPGSELDNLTDPEHFTKPDPEDPSKVTGLQPITPEEPLEYDETGIRHDLVSLVTKSNEKYEYDDQLDPSNLKSIITGKQEDRLPTAEEWHNLFAEQFQKFDSEEDLEQIWESKPESEKKEIYNVRRTPDGRLRYSGKAVNKVIEKIAISEIGADEWRKLNETLTQGMWFAKEIEEINVQLSRMIENDPLEFSKNPEYQRLIKKKEGLDQCPKCIGRKVQENGEKCDRCLGTGNKVEGTIESNKQAKFAQRKKIRALSKAKAKFDINPESYTDEIKKARHEIISGTRFGVASARALERGTTCEVCNGKGTLKIDPAKELANIEDEIKQRKENFNQSKKAIQTSIDEIEAELKTLQVQTAKGEKGAQEQLEATQEKQKSLRNTAEGILLTSKKGIEDLKTRHKHIRNNKIKEDKCYACAGTGEPAVRSTTRIRGGEGLTLEANIQKLNDAINQAHEFACIVCDGAGESEDKQIYLRLTSSEQVPKVGKLIDKFIENRNIYNERWVTTRPDYINDYLIAARKTIKARGSGSGVAVGPDAPNIPTLTSRLQQLQSDIQHIEAYFKSLEKTPVRKSEQRDKPEFSSNLMQLDIINSWHSKQPVLLDETAPKKLADELVAAIQDTGAKATAIGKKCSECGGYGRLNKHIADGIRGMWAQSFNRIVQDSLPRHGQFLSNILTATEEYELGVPCEKEYGEHCEGENCPRCEGKGRVGGLPTIDDGKYVVAYTSQEPDFEDYGIKISGSKVLWGFRPNDAKRYLKITDLADRIAGNEQVKCQDCQKGIQIKRVGQANNPSGEKFLYPGGRLLKLTSIQKERVTNGETIRIDNEIYSQCRTCDGVGRLPITKEPLDLEKNPIYVERRDDPYQHYQNEYRGILNGLPVKKGEIEPRYQESEKHLKKDVSRFIKLRHPALYRLLNKRGELANWVESYQGKPEELEDAIAREMENTTIDPRPLRIKGVSRIIQVIPYYSQEYGSDMQQQALKLAQKDKRGSDWDDLYVTPEEIEKFLTKHNASRTTGEKRLWDSLDDTAKRDWRDRTQRSKKDEYLALAKAIEIAANNLKWDRKNLELVERNWDELPRSRKTYFIEQAKAGSLTIGDQEAKPLSGSITIVFEDISSKIISEKTYEIPYGSRVIQAAAIPTLLQVFPISELREQDAEKEKNFSPKERPPQTWSPPRDSRERQQGRGARGKRKGGGGREKSERRKRRESSEKSERRKRKQKGISLDDSINRSLINVILEDMDQVYDTNSIDPEYIAKFLDD